MTEGPHTSIRRWWHRLGQARYPGALKLLITADSGGSNGVRVRLWKVELQKLARELGLEISVGHLPPGTSKWNRIEHRLFSFISQNWRGKPLRNLATIINLIGATTTGTGLKVYCDRDTNTYPTGVKVSPSDMAPWISGAPSSTATGTTPCCQPLISFQILRDKP